MELVRRRQSARKFVIPIDVIGIDHITDPHLGGIRLRPFVDPAQMPV